MKIFRAVCFLRNPALPKSAEKQEKKEANINIRVIEHHILRIPNEITSRGKNIRSNNFSGFAQTKNKREAGSINLKKKARFN